MRLKWLLERGAVPGLVLTKQPDKALATHGDRETQHVRQSEEQHRPRREVRVHFCHAPAPATVTGTAEMKRCHDHATAGRAGSGGDRLASSTLQGAAAFQLGEGGCVQPSE